MRGSYPHSLCVLAHSEVCYLLCLLCGVSTATYKMHLDVSSIISHQVNIIARRYLRANLRWVK